MNTKSIGKWFPIVLMLAIIFFLFGFMYGQTIATDNCNKFWEDKTQTLGYQMGKQISCNFNPSDVNITPIPVN